MEDWLKEKKMVEAQKIAQLKSTLKNDNFDRTLKEDMNYRGYKEWLRNQMLKEKSQ
jgi:hypothetical protein